MLSLLLTINTATTLTIVQPSLIMAGMFCVLIFSVALVSLFLALRRRVKQLTSELASRSASLSNFGAELEAQALLARQMSKDLEELRRRVINHDEISQSASSVWQSAGLPVNLNRRGQILRLFRKGKSVAEIASDLRVAQGEVELLLKVHDLSQMGINSEN
jgi:hypothetical protein